MTWIVSYNCIQALRRYSDTLVRQRNALIFNLYDNQKFIEKFFQEAVQGLVPSQLEYSSS